MPKNTNVNNTGRGGAPLALAGVSTVLATASAPPANSIQCDTCFLNLPRNASHIDVTSHVCYRGFSIALNASGHVVLT